MPFDEDALEVYLERSTDPACIFAKRECFRAGFGIDLEHDAADRAAGGKIGCPTLDLWGDAGVTGRHTLILQRFGTRDARTLALRSCEAVTSFRNEAPKEALTALRPFFTEGQISAESASSKPKEELIVLPVESARMPRAAPGSIEVL